MPALQEKPVLGTNEREEPVFESVPIQILVNALIVYGKRSRKQVVFGHGARGVMADIPARDGKDGIYRVSASKRNGEEGILFSYYNTSHPTAIPGVRKCWFWPLDDVMKIDLTQFGHATSPGADS